MEILNKAEACFDEDFLDFTLEGELVGEENDSKDSVSSSESKTTTLSHGMNVSSFSIITQDIVEEELEWLSNKDSFPSVETFFGILSDNPQLVPTRNMNSSISTNSADEANGISIVSCSVGLKAPIKFPARARSKRLQKRRLVTADELPTQQCLSITKGQVIDAKNRQESSSSSLDFGRRCLHCQSDKTPQWRAGPMGPKTLCNACGVRYKSGRLLPEYRPANSPTFSSALHSNSHRKVVEMRKQKYVVGFGGGFVVNDGAC